MRIELFPAAWGPTNTILYALILTWAKELSIFKYGIKFINNNKSIIECDDKLGILWTSFLTFGKMMNFGFFSNFEETFMKWGWFAFWTRILNLSWQVSHAWIQIWELQCLTYWMIWLDLDCWCCCSLYTMWKYTS